MGSPEGEAGRYDDERQTKVRLTRGFWMAETEVTQAQWRAVMGTRQVEQVLKVLSKGGEPLDQEWIKSTMKSYRLAKEKQITFCDSMVEVTWEDLWVVMERERDAGLAAEYGPIHHITHSEAEDWCTAADRHARIPGWTITLPGEAQWEYACRAGSSRRTYAGEWKIRGEYDVSGLDGIAWYGGNSGRGFEGMGWELSKRAASFPPGVAGPRRVGEKQPNAWGLHDMLGNVSEWCADWYGPYPQTIIIPRGAGFPGIRSQGRLEDPRGPGRGLDRISRGGAWSTSGSNCRAALRGYAPPYSRTRFRGFRPVILPRL